MGVPREVLGDPWGSLGGSLGVLGGAWGVPRGHQKRRLFSGGVLGWSWEALGLFLEVLDHPWVSPEKSNVATSFVLDYFLKCPVFFLVDFFHRYLKATFFSHKHKKRIVFISILGVDMLQFLWF